MALDSSDASAVPLGELPTDVVWRMSLDGEILYVSSEVQRVRGLSAEEAKAQMVEQIHTPESAQASLDYILQLRAAVEAGGELPTFHDTLIYLRADGSEYPCEVRAVPSVNADGVVEILGVSRGIQLGLDN